MATNILEAIQKNLGYPPLKKVDPNTQELKDAREMTPDQKLAQSAIPAVLAALIKFSDSNEGINMISGNESKDWLSVIYHGKENEAIKKIADYAGVPADVTERHMENISDEAVKIVRETVKNPNPEKLRSYMNSQRHNILAHLPAALQMGDLLNEETFDDRTNKMEGPVSGFLHRIENII